MSFDENFACLNVSYVTLRINIVLLLHKKNHLQNIFLYVHVKEAENAEEQRQVPSNEFATHNLSSLDIDHNPCVGNKNKEADAVSTEYMESLILLSSKSNSSHASEEEIVDITEPRFESFCMTDGLSLENTLLE